MARNPSQPHTPRTPGNTVRRNNNTSQNTTRGSTDINSSADRRIQESHQNRHLSFQRDNHVDPQHGRRRSDLEESHFGEIDDDIQVEEGENEPENEDEDESQDPLRCEGILTYPNDMNRKDVQRILNKAVLERSRNQDGTPKRHYDGSKLDGLFDDGEQVWNAMMRTCRLQFSRYLTVPTAAIPDIIDKAVGKQVDRDSTAYSKTYTRVLEWRKNWFTVYMRNVDILQQKLEAENTGYEILPRDRLKEAYVKAFSFESLYFIMGTMSSVVDWRATIAQPRVGAMYKTMFTYSIVYAHMARHFPGVLTRAQALTRIKLLGRAAPFRQVGVGSLVLLPVRPPRKVRLVKRAPEDITELDPEFSVIDDDDIDDMEIGTQQT